MKFNIEDVVTLDFETYYAKDYTLTSMPMSEYILDPRFKAHCVAVKQGVKDTVVYVGDEIEPALASIDWSNKYLLAHNCAFDGFILTQRYNHVPRVYLDTLSMSRGISGIAESNRLSYLAEKYELGVKNSQALLNTKGVRDLSPEQIEHLRTYCGTDVDLCFLLFAHLVTAIPSAELELIDLTLRMFCEPVIRVNTERAQEALESEFGAKGAALIFANVSAEQLTSNKQFADLLLSKGIQPPEKISPTTGKVTWAFAKTDPGMKHLLANGSDEIKRIIDARLKLKSTIGEKRAERLVQAGANSRPLPVLLNYCGAHTTRWSAGNKMNMQNLPRPEYDANKQLVAGTGELRRSLMAPEGHKFVIGDSSQIEARLNAWFCGEDKIVSAFAAADKGVGPDVYRVMAALIFSTDVANITPNQRQLGKVIALALGYGMGAEKFQVTAANGKPPLHLDESFCAGAVKQYRKVACPFIANMWRTLDNVITGMQLGVPGEYGCIKWGKHHIKLPNGLKLHYPSLDVTAGGIITYNSKGKLVKLYGGLLLENIIQALARCVVASQMLAISKQFRVVMMAHDEIVCVAPLERVEECEQFMLSSMRTVPEWAPGLPLNAEVKSDFVYSK